MHEASLLYMWTNYPSAISVFHAAIDLSDTNWTSAPTPWLSAYVQCCDAKQVISNTSAHHFPLRSEIGIEPEVCVHYPIAINVFQSANLSLMISTTQIMWRA
ncbi:hypothetical protein AVEN_135588-1 [Araneus ventricosus]|uniref:Uncharacterized protein n=1 Tax=Araneus ventricosus TaxID=182803 RepID=A0A4Y2AZ19_ARAVE|nr:hypothetical protein AVEN_135588-1 [Araneus ventricosus]